VFIRDMRGNKFFFAYTEPAMTLLISIATELLKAIVPELLEFLWSKAHEPTTIEDAQPDAARRDRLLAAIRLRRSAGSNDPNHPTPPAG
jgi:hypothetical protein